jgi:hypothetical protein
VTIIFKLMLFVLGATGAVWFFRDLGKAKKNWREVRRREQHDANRSSEA